jgi:hypothetical protein
MKSDRVVGGRVLQDLFSSGEQRRYIGEEITQNDVVVNDLHLYLSRRCAMRGVLMYL